MSNLQERISNLNPEQQQAVMKVEGPVLVVAGPGTGKTQVLALRIANILQTTDAKASNILCLTFTESGVLAMRKRLQGMIGNEAYYVRIHTFHSFANEVIQNFPEKFAFARELVQLDDLGRVKILREIIDTFADDAHAQLVPFYNRYQYQSDIAGGIQTLKREGVTPVQFTEIVAGVRQDLIDNPEINSKTGKPKATWLAAEKNCQRLEELASIYGKYQEAIAARGLYDYEDMIMFVTGKFAEDDELLAHYQERYLYILVDEYQDTNGAQNKLLQLLGSFDASPNIFAVGDDDQAIYRFQGANVENLLFFTRQFAGVATIPITTNYRSSQLILDVASSLIKHNSARLTNIVPGLSKELHAGLSIPEHRLKVAQLSTQDKENFYLVDQVRRLHNEGVEYADMAVIYRRHRDAEDIAQVFLKAGIPVTIKAGENALDAQIVQQLITLLKAIHYKSSDRDTLLFQVLFYKFLDLPRLDIFKLTRVAGDRKLSLFDVLLDEKLHTELAIDNSVKIREFAEALLEWHQASANLSLLQLVEVVAAESDYMNYVFALEDAIEAINSVNSFFNYVRQLSRQNKQAKLADLLNDLSLLTENNLGISEQRLDLQQDAVNMMTAHAAKGLEYKYVFIPKFYDGNWGGFKRREIIKLPSEVFNWSGAEQAVEAIAASDPELEDERRLLFVALTRAKEQIHISYADEYLSGQSTKQVAPSAFLTELDSARLEHVDTASYEQADIESIKLQLSPVIHMDYSAAEGTYLRSLIADFKLSPSALNEYLECPLRFKFNRLLKVPQPQAKTLSLGTSIHFGLEHFLRKLKNEGVEDKDYLLWLFDQQLDRELIGEEEKSETRAEGRKLLTDYYENYQGSFVAPVEVEYGFYGRGIVLESAGIEAIPLTGKIDKISWVDADHYLVKVTDYKTSKPKSANEIMGQTKNSDGGIYRQLVFYKLLSDLDDAFRPSRSLPKYKIEEAEVDFIKPNDSGIFKREVFRISADDVEALKQTITEVMTEIRNLNFGGSEKFPLCGECVYCQLLQQN